MGEMCLVDPRRLQVGQGLAEYALILVLIAVACMSALALLGTDGVGSLWGDQIAPLIHAMGG
jgi:Flp pilus assembly pilin Flp